MSEAKPQGLLFCPFCEESFEQGERCPEHDIPLVGFEGLAKMRQRAIPRDHEEVEPMEWRYGRGVIVAGALLLVGAYALPFVVSSYGTQERVQSALGLALEQAKNLWVLPAVAVTTLSIVFRRRTPEDMRGARVVVPVLGVMAMFSVGFTLWRIWSGADAIFQRLGTEIEIQLSWGCPLLFAGAAMIFGGGLIFGREPKEAAPKYRVQ